MRPVPRAVGGADCAARGFWKKLCCSARLTFFPVIISSSFRMPQRKLEQLLLNSRVVDPAELANRVADADQSQSRLGWSLIESGTIDERVLARVVSEGTQTPLIERLPDEVSPWIYRRIPSPIARQYQIVPLELKDQTLTVAMIDPTDTDALEVLAAASGFTISPVVALKSSLHRLIEHVYPFDIDVDATRLSPQNMHDDSGEQSVQTNPVVDPGATAAITAPLNLSASPSTLESIEKRLEVVEKQLDQISTLAAQARLALDQIRKTIK